MVARLEDIFGLFPEENCADGQAVAEPFGGADDIRLHPEGLIAVEEAGAPVAGLHLVNQQQDIPFLAEGGDLFHKFGFERDDPALSLNHFNHNSGGVPADLCKQILKVVCLGIAEAGGKGIEKPVHRRLSGGGQGRDGAPVKGVDQGDDLAALGAVLFLGVLPRGFDHALIGLGAGVREEHLLHPGFFAEELCRFLAGGRVVVVADMGVFLRLL